ncbi:MAG: class II fructose-bisphosphate aldolase [Dehalococcoidia bacterium]|nr:class II fructose-bisphosphate aldolase [Dehalococcoidia bacterium]
MAISHQSKEELKRSLAGILAFEEERVAEVTDPARLRDEAIDGLIRAAVFAPTDAVREFARQTIRQAAALLNATPASIQRLYAAMGRGEEGGFTVPALNLRILPYDAARAVFQAASDLETGPIIFEIARSEIGYTAMRPAEYAANVEAAAIREGYSGPLFIQGDHFQVNASRYRSDPETELRSLRELTDEAVRAGFLNIDVDSSTLVDLSQPSIREQQRPNFVVAAEMIRFIRSIEPPGDPISIGVEIGEVGGKNSTPEELRAFMDGLRAELGNLTGPSKISVQTGSSHGGVVLPDGSMAEVAIAFETLEEMSRVAREEYGMAGAVQHGASTLPDELFHRFREVGTAEIHLATAFQNMVYDSPLFPETLRQEIHAYLKEKHAEEWKPGQTEAQFIYSNRKRALGPFKRQMWELPEDARSDLRRGLKERFAFLFRQLSIDGRRALLDNYA